MAITINKLTPIKYQIQNLNEIVDLGSGNYRYDMQILWSQTIANNVLQSTDYRIAEDDRLVFGGTWAYTHSDNTNTFTNGSSVSDYSLSLIQQRSSQTENITINLPAQSGTLALLTDAPNLEDNILNYVFDSGTNTAAYKPYTTGDEGLTIDATWLAAHPGVLYKGDTDPTEDERLNYNGILYATEVISTEMSVGDGTNSWSIEAVGESLNFEYLSDNLTKLEISPTTVIIRSEEDFTPGSSPDPNPLNKVFQILSKDDNELFSVKENGDTVIAGVLTVNGAGTSTFAGDVDINGNLHVAGDATFEAFIYGDNMDITGNLLVQGNTRLGNQSTDIVQLDGKTSAIKDFRILDARKYYSGGQLYVFKGDSWIASTIPTTQPEASTVKEQDQWFNTGTLTLYTAIADETWTGAQTELIGTTQPNSLILSAASISSDSSTFGLFNDRTDDLTLNIASGITANTETKTINLGLGGDTGSITNINIGASGAGVGISTVTIYGNLIVEGTTTTVNTTQLDLADNILLLNSDYTGSSPSENAGIEIERGTLNNASLLWDEGEDRWEADGHPLAYKDSTLAQFASTTSSQLAGVISDETGTGKLAFATSPTFTTSIKTDSSVFSIFDDATLTSATMFAGMGASDTVIIGNDANLMELELNANTTVSGTLQIDGNTLIGYQGTSSDDDVPANLTIHGNLSITEYNSDSTPTLDTVMSISLSTIDLGAADTVVNINSETDATSSTAAGVIIDGGLAVAKKAYIGGGLAVGSSAQTWELDGSTEPSFKILSGSTPVEKFAISNTGVVTVTAADGVSPFSITSTTKVNNLNVEKVDGADLETTLSPASDAFIPTSKAVATYVSSAVGGSLTTTQSANTVLAGPESGGDAATSFRALVNADLPTSGVNAGTYSAVQVNTKGVVTSGAQILEVGYYNSVPTETTNKPTINLAIGGLFFEALEAVAV